MWTWSRPKSWLRKNPKRKGLLPKRPRNFRSVRSNGKGKSKNGEKSVTNSGSRRHLIARPKTKQCWTSWPKWRGSRRRKTPNTGQKWTKCSGSRTSSRK